jgi:hypothetical protein
MDQRVFPEQMEEVATLCELEASALLVLVLVLRNTLLGKALQLLEREELILEMS